jgi:hypothetical protein
LVAIKVDATLTEKASPLRLKHMVEHGEDKLSVEAAEAIVSVYVATVHQNLTSHGVLCLPPADLRQKLNAFIGQHVNYIYFGTYDNSDSRFEHQTDPSVEVNVYDSAFGALSTDCLEPGWLVVNSFNFLGSYDDVGGNWKVCLRKQGVDIVEYERQEATFQHCMLAALQPSVMAVMGRDETNGRFVRHHSLAIWSDRLVDLGHIGTPTSIGYFDKCDTFINVALMPHVPWMGKDTDLCEEVERARPGAEAVLLLHYKTGRKFSAAMSKFRVIQDPKTTVKKKKAHEAKTDEEKQATKDRIAATVALQTDEDKQATKDQQAATVALRRRLETDEEKQARIELYQETVAKRATNLYKTGNKVTCMRVANKTYTNEVLAGICGEVTADQENWSAPISVKWQMPGGTPLEIQVYASYLYRGHYPSLKDANKHKKKAQRADLKERTKAKK